VIAFPGLVISDQQKTAVDLDKIELEAPSRGYGEPVPEPSVPPPADGKPEAAPVSPEEASEDDPMEAVRRALQNEAKK
jgi:hypothetical protein